MKTIRKFRTALVLSTIACMILCTAGFDSCSKDKKQQGIAFARDLAGSIRVAAPIVAQKNPELARRMEQAANSADRIVTAIEASNSTEIAALVRDILPIFTEVARQFSDNQNVLIGLALGQIALNFFVNHYVKSGGVAASVAPEIENFKALPQFGCQYRPDRCK
jgi:hypothetical protein